jgi:hypothetical protein
MEGYFTYKNEKFKSQDDLIDFLVQNKTALIAEKKYEVKKTDAISFSPEPFESETANKSIADPSTFTGDKLKVKLVLNTTGIMDSHSDVHIDGLWSKTLKENKSIYLLQEHDMSFKSIITDNVKASLSDMNWKDLGYNKIGKTQALIFDAVLNKSRNPFMFDQYLNGYVKNHSVGMRYVKIDMAVNNKDYASEYAVWQKYIDSVINKQDAIDKGYFWAVTEAKLVEGSAVVMGSNKVTPTLSVEEKEEPEQSTNNKNEPFIHSPQAKEIINNFKFIK